MPVDIACAITTVIVFFIIKGSIAVNCNGKIIKLDKTVSKIKIGLAKMKFRITLNVARRRVYVYGTKVPDIYHQTGQVIKRTLSRDRLGKFNLTIRTNIFEILIAEDQNFPLSGEQSKLIQALLRKFGYLDA